MLLLLLLHKAGWRGVAAAPAPAVARGGGRRGRGVARSRSRSRGGSGSGSGGELGRRGPPSHQLHAAVIGPGRQGRPAAPAPAPAATGVGSSIIGVQVHGQLHAPGRRG